MKKIVLSVLVAASLGAVLFFTYPSNDCGCVCTDEACVCACQDDCQCITCECKFGCKVD